MAKLVLALALAASAAAEFAPIASYTPGSDVTPHARSGARRYGNRAFFQLGGFGPYLPRRASKRSLGAAAAHADREKSETRGRNAKTLRPDDAEHCPTRVEPHTPRRFLGARRATFTTFAEVSLTLRAAG